MLPRRTPTRITRNKRAPVKVEKPKRATPASSHDWGRIRVWCVGIFFALLWGGLWARAFYLQIIMGPEYAAMAKRQYMSSEEVVGVRGNIMDRNGNVLARSVDCRSVWANPALVVDKQATAVKLAQVLNVPMARIFSQLQEKRQFVWLERKLDYHVAEKIKALSLPGVYLDSEYERVYPYKHLAGQLLGFVNIDDKGIEGLEKSFEERLIGRSVRQVVERDASGRKLMAQGTGEIGDLRGQDVRLTIDTQVQFFAEEALAENVEKYGAKWGGCIVVDVPTGDVLAWAQYPFFDPNNVTATTVGNRRNRLAMDMLEQGSTIKSFLIAAALEEKVVTPSTVINCEKGVWKLRTATFHDTHPYANLTVDKILHVSSNIGAAKIGLKLGAVKYRDYLIRLGFGERSDLPLANEARGILRTTQKWSEVDLAAASFGQSFSTTLVQMAQAYLCLASDGMKKPLRLVIEDTPAAEAPQVGSIPGQGEAMPAPGGDKIFSPATMKQVRAMMREVVEEEGGTGKEARIPGMVVGGKTGTAQKADKTGKYGRGRVGSFVGMVPIEEPRYLICVLLDEPTAVQYGGIIAAPVFKYVALRTMAYHGLLPDSDDPVVLAANQKEAERKAKSSGKPAKKPATAAETKKEGDAAAARAADVKQQQAAARSAAQASQTVPVVVGMSLQNAVGVFAEEGIVPHIKGKGSFVVRQMPEPGTAWSDTKRECTLWLEERES